MCAVQVKYVVNVDRISDKCIVWDRRKLLRPDQFSKGILLEIGVEIWFWGGKFPWGGRVIEDCNGGRL